MALPTRERIIELFDELVADGVVLHSASHFAQVDSGGYPVWMSGTTHLLGPMLTWGLQFELRICPVLATKPTLADAKQDNPLLDRTATFGDGSDINCGDMRLIIARINESHLLVFNKFCVHRPQLLLLTLDSYRRQHEALEMDDFDAALETLRALDSMYVIYNCGEAAGCSRRHKHMQVLQGPPFAFEAFSDTNMKDKSTIPFRYFSHRLTKGKEETAASLHQAYKALLGQARGALSLDSALDSDVCPHNVVIYQDRIIVIPRRRAAFQHASANAAGMLGSAWVPNQANAEEWISLGPLNVLRELGVPN